MLILQEPEGPDHFFVAGGPVDGLNRLADGGPRYQETPLDPFSADAAAIAEPWNTVTAALFIGIVGYWLVMLFRRRTSYPFVMACLPILLAGGIGGTIYHANRTQKAYFLLDVIPISLLGLAGSCWLTVRLSRSLGWWRIAAYGIGLFVVYLAVNGLLFSLIQSENKNLRVNLSYASLAVVILTPISVVLVRTKFRYGRWVLAAIGCFALAWLCRLVDRTALSPLSMGTHWLWHIFGAITTQILIAYFVKLEEERIEYPPLLPVGEFRKDVVGQLGDDHRLV